VLAGFQFNSNLAPAGFAADPAVRCCRRAVWVGWFGRGALGLEVLQYIHAGLRKIQRASIGDEKGVPCVHWHWFEWRLVLSRGGRRVHRKLQGLQMLACECCAGVGSVLCFVLFMGEAALTVRASCMLLSKEMIVAVCALCVGVCVIRHQPHTSCGLVGRCYSALLVGAICFCHIPGTDGVLCGAALLQSLDGGRG
jgi:hypothetical protein